MRKYWLIIQCLLIGVLMNAQSEKKKEVIFASYFDIATNSPAYSEVFGRLHLERNKDVNWSPIPSGYHFEIIRQEEPLFTLTTEYDLASRVMGVLRVAPGRSIGSSERSYSMTIALKDGSQILNQVDVIVKVVNTPLWNILYERYSPFTMEESRLYGRTKYNEKELENLISEIEKNSGRIPGYRCYTAHPKDYLNNTVRDSLNGRLYGTIDYEWESVSNQIGGLGYAYVNSTKYGGPKGTAGDHERLKKAIYSSITAYAKALPVEGKDLLIDGKPIGRCTGDGTSLLSSHKMMSHQMATHQWMFSDPIIAPAVQVMPEMIKDMQRGDKQAIAAHHALIQIFQTASAEVEGRRAIDNPNERWGELRDTIKSEGAWADANLGHRSRMLLALPILWADYNRPMTYVQYWYTDFFPNRPFDGFSYSNGWSPRGVVLDVARWMTKYNVPAKAYQQSGFHPDGSISHHVDKGTDMAMYAYGFQWITDLFKGLSLFKNTDFQVDSRYYQPAADRLLNVYPKLIYQGDMDYLVCGRSFYSDMNGFVKKNYLPAVDNLIASKGSNTVINHEEELVGVAKNIKSGKHKISISYPFWVTEFLLHRKGEKEAAFYASVKLKSERTLGAEDFDRVRKSWHLGYGAMQLKVDGNEYAQRRVLSNFDFHAVPGITEEWRTDPLPAKGGAAACPAGANRIAGVLADGCAGMAIYHHLPNENYSSATAYKSYHFMDDMLVMLGSDIARLRKGQGEDIVTFVDQSFFESPITLFDGVNEQVIAPSSSVNRVISLTQMVWVHTGKKGYVIYPQEGSQLLIRTGKEINVTDKKGASGEANFIIAISHGKQPQPSASYHYVMIPNVVASQMGNWVDKCKKSLFVTQQKKAFHALYSSADSLHTFAFFDKSKVTCKGVTVEVDGPANLMLRQKKGGYAISLNDPTANANRKQITLRLSIPLKEGRYSYTLGGLYPRQGETALVKRDGDGALVIVELPDTRDDKYYDYKAELYAAAPILLEIPNSK